MKGKWTLLFLLAGAILGAQPSLTGYPALGSLPSQVISLRGVPDEIYPLRGENPSEDLVVFYYEQAVYFYFSANRLWQIRWDDRFEGGMEELRMGMERKRIPDFLGEPFAILDTSDIYSYIDQGDAFPVRLRLFYEEDRLVDAYYYRGDY